LDHRRKQDNQANLAPGLIDSERRPGLIEPSGIDINPWR
jgi:hypothetical protein